MSVIGSETCNRDGEDCPRTCQFYVLFLGYRSIDGDQPQEVSLVLRQLLIDCQTVQRSKVTVQLSRKGMKIVQNRCSSAGWYAARRSPKKRNDVIRLAVNAESIVDVRSAIEHDEVVSCLFVVGRQLQLHAYRCDSAESAGALYRSIRSLIDHHQRQIQPARTPSIDCGRRVVDQSAVDSIGDRSAIQQQLADQSIIPTANGSFGLRRAMFRELKQKLGLPASLPPKDYRRSQPESIDCNRPIDQDRLVDRPPANTTHEYDSPASVIDWSATTNTPKKLRWFGDTLHLKSDGVSAVNGRRLSSIIDRFDQEDDRLDGSVGDGNWMARPRFIASMMELHPALNDASSRRASSVDNSLSSTKANQYQQCVQQANQQAAQQKPKLSKRALCDPFGRLYQHRTTVENFRENVRLPTRIEDHYGVWYFVVQ